MVAGNTEETALGSARGRFFEGLPRKAMELQSAVALLAASPAAEAPRDDMLRRLNALYASALLFRNDALATALQEGIERLDEAREQRRPLSTAELELLAGLVQRLPELRDEGERALALPEQLVVSAPRETEPSVSELASALPTDVVRTPSERGARLHDDDEHEEHEQHGDDERPTLTPASRLDYSAREPLLQRVLHVFLLARVGELRELIELLRAESLRVSAFSSVEELIASASEDAPDIVLANESLAREADLALRLRSDGKSDFTPIVLYERGETLDHAVAPADGDLRMRWPFSSEQLVQTLGLATGTLIAPLGPAPLGELTVAELAERVAQDIRRALDHDAIEGRTHRVSIAREADILSVTYGAVAELRAAMMRESGGEVRFAARPIDRGPAVVAADLTADLRLGGRRVLLVEDDTAIALLLANHLRAQGATVHQLSDGDEALSAARRERPDLVIAGTRVPGLDAFALTRSLAREPLLADVPLLLLPPKERLLVRAKDTGVVQLAREQADQVLASAASLLAARTELEERLRHPGEVRGSLEGTGVVALLRSVRRTRPDARVCVRDAWNLFECELREGRLAQVTRTACDGSFVRNERALPQLLGTRAGRFSVAPADAPLKASFEGTLDEVLTRGARSLAAELDAVSGSRLERAARVVFDDDAYALLVEATPRAVRTVLERLQAGEAPLALVQGGLDRAALVEPLLLDLMRRGALRAVVGSEGEDLIAEAARVREREQPTQLASPLSLVPPPPNPVISVLGAQPREPAMPEPVPAPPEAPRVPAETTSAEVSSALGAARARESSIADATELAAATAEARRSKSTLAAWTVALLALGAVAFFVAREPDGGIMPVEAIGAPRRVTPGDGPLPVREGVASGDGFTLYDEILEADAPVGADEGLLVIDARFEGMRVWLDGRELPRPPLRLPVARGDHEVAVQRGDAISYRYLTVQPGKSWVLQDP